jgi:hypothetical protein
MAKKATTGFFWVYLRFSIKFEIREISIAAGVVNFRKAH